MGEASVPTEHSQASPTPWVPPPHVDQGGTGDPVRTAPQGSPAPVGLTAATAVGAGTAAEGIPRFTPETVKGRKAFAALARNGRRVRRGTITVTWVRGDPAEPPRVAYAVGRRAGGAVVRNRIRRRLRAVVRDVSNELRPGSYLIGAGREAATVPYGELRATVSEALRGVVR